MKEYQNEIGTDIEYILLIIIKLISKWKKFSIKSRCKSCIPLTPNQIASEIVKFQSIQISSKDSINILQKILIANSTNYNTIVGSLSKSIN